MPRVNPIEKTVVNSGRAAQMWRATRAGLPNRHDVAATHYKQVVDEQTTQFGMSGLSVRQARSLVLLRQVPTGVPLTPVGVSVPSDLMGGGADQDSFEVYEARVRRYGYEWFRSDEAAVGVLQRMPEVRAQVNRLALGFQTVGTELLYRSGGRWRAERTGVQQKVLQEALRLGGYDVDNHDGDRLPQAVMLLGLPGSGKSSMLRPIAELVIRRLAGHPGVILDTDHVRTLLPEYADGLGSEVVHPETSHVANRLLVDRAAELRLNLILDKVGDPEKTVKEAQFLQDEGWSVWCLCAQVDVEVAIDRAKQRALTCGRYVPPHVVRELGNRPLQAYEALRRSPLHLSGCALLDTEVPTGRRPLVVDANPEDCFGKPGLEVAMWPEPSVEDAQEMELP